MIGNTQILNLIIVIMARKCLISSRFIYILISKIVPLDNVDIVAKIKSSYRIEFLIDVALARSIPDRGLSSLNSFLYFNHVEIAAYFYESKTYFSQVFELLSSENTPIEKKKEVLNFLIELCGVVKELPKQHQASYYMYFYIIITVRLLEMGSLDCLNTCFVVMMNL
jgi:hypothetical protein